MRLWFSPQAQVRGQWAEGPHGVGESCCGRAPDSWIQFFPGQLSATSLLSSFPPTPSSQPEGSSSLCRRSWLRPSSGPSWARSG